MSISPCCEIQPYPFPASAIASRRLKSRLTQALPPLITQPTMSLSPVEGAPFQDSSDAEDVEKNDDPKPEMTPAKPRSDKLTPNELRDLLALEAVLPWRGGLDQVDETKTTSWSAIFLLARREIVHTKALLDEVMGKSIDLGWEQHRLLTENGEKDEMIGKLEEEVEELKHQRLASAETEAFLRRWERKC